MNKSKITEGDVVRLEAIGTDQSADLEYKWDKKRHGWDKNIPTLLFGDKSGNTATMVHTDHAGDYTINLTITNSYGNTDFTSRNVTIHPEQKSKHGHEGANLTSTDQESSSKGSGFSLTQALLSLGGITLLNKYISNSSDNNND